MSMTWYTDLKKPFIAKIQWFICLIKQPSRAGRTIEYGSAIILSDIYICQECVK